MVTMEFTGKAQHQGDVEIFEIKSLPEGLKKVDKQFVAASERSGSFHALFGNYDMYEAENGFCIDVKEDCILNHSLQTELNGITLDNVKVLPKKDHNANLLPKGIYYVGIQNRFDPLEGARKRVKD